MHDLTVGLISFDCLYVPLSCAAKLRDLLGSATFWALVKDGIFRFIYFENEPVIVFRSIDDVDGGDIGQIHVSAAEGSGPLTAEEQIRRQFQATPGSRGRTSGLQYSLHSLPFSITHRSVQRPSKEKRPKLPFLARGSHCLLKDGHGPARAHVSAWISSTNRTMRSILVPLILVSL
jgi:hypothetical protein